MGTEKRVTTPLTEEAIAALQAGDSVLLSGVIYTARDKAHKLFNRNIGSRQRTAGGFVQSAYLLCGTGSGQTGSAHWFLRAYYQQPYGQLCANVDSSGGIKRDAGQRPQKSGSDCCHEGKQSGLLGGYWRYWCGNFPCSKKSGSNCL